MFRRWKQIPKGIEKENKEKQSNCLGQKNTESIFEGNDLEQKENNDNKVGRGQTTLRVDLENKPRQKDLRHTLVTKST